jgi:ribosomal protein S14
MTTNHNFNFISPITSTNYDFLNQNKTNPKTSNLQITAKYLRKSTYINYFIYSLFIQNIYYNKKEVFYYFKNFCIYTKRLRSVFRSFKMCRHQMKEVVDKNSISNIYV